MRWFRAVVLASALALGLSGCAGLAPGDAAQAGERPGFDRCGIWQTAALADYQVLSIARSLQAVVPSPARALRIVGYEAALASLMLGAQLRSCRVTLPGTVPEAAFDQARAMPQAEWRTPESPPLEE